MANEKTDFSTTPGSLDIDLNDQGFDTNNMDGPSGIEDATGSASVPSGSKGGATRGGDFSRRFDQGGDAGTNGDIGGAETDATGSGLSGIGNSGAKGGSTRTSGISGDGIDEDVDSGVGPDIDEETATDTPIDDSWNNRDLAANPI